MASVFSDDAYCLGLIYAYVYGKKRMVSYTDLIDFHAAIEKNLEGASVLDMYVTMRSDDPSIYYTSEGKNGELYYVLYPDFDLERAMNKYIGSLSSKTIGASQKNNALNCIGLEKVNRRIQPKSKYEVKRKNSNDFLDDLLKRISNGEVSINSNSKEFNKEYIIDNLKELKSLLDSNIIYDSIIENKSKLLTKNKCK